MPDETQLFDAVARVMARQPGSSMQEIATAAGISRTTLHRAFGDRETLVETLTAHVLADCERAFDAAGIDHDDPQQAFDRLLDDALTLAKAYSLLFSEPHIHRVPRLVDEIAEQETRLARFFERGQRAGQFRPELPPQWLAYSVGAQLEAIWWAIEDGHVGARDAARLLRATILGGIAVRS
ncbi:TetR/AcrR family transcriptional regulator [Conexibacter sp. JD483]|uniref:TetR/AcrR family transcriptional regulator n=1 Tax=unclassified Conexibacter TaxID=2627773 RepID=UPI0027206339|nr:MULTISPECIES: TetR/AcrR family transcriptional regulator [unclassified Conexibacter]MDO8186354.1 TetR/AcrR family transcriptional regulator [Conexibacter sp. CPCC 205706]MDO8199753.1 TetR/AcrR family transcriptional regulator [Conexibacter sp. CPCC 205762]MDR9372961.1 TetR/AcrR family transcriptional regulator [Conexibacter sp. JD483]